jgi:hypothetical protein
MSSKKIRAILAMTTALVANTLTLPSRGRTLVEQLPPPTIHAGRPLPPAPTNEALARAKQMGRDAGRKGR